MTYEYRQPLDNEIKPLTAKMKKNGNRRIKQEEWMPQ
jgi:hypothetical protein